MGTAEKKQRREVNEFLNNFSLRYQKETYPLRERKNGRDMLVEFASPLETLFDSISTRLSFAIFAWNLSLAPKDRRNELLEEFLGPLVGDSEDGKKMVTDLIESLIERRESLYPEETVVVVPNDDDSPSSETTE